MKIFAGGNEETEGRVTAGKDAWEKEKKEKGKVRREERREEEHED